MKSNINITPLRTWSKIPTSWEARPNQINYHQLPASEHEADGWVDVIVPTITDTQRLGALIVSGEVVTYEVVDIPIEELQQRFENQIQSTQSELIEGEKQRQAMATFQAITDESEAFEVKEVFPFWGWDYDYLTVAANYKVKRTLLEDGAFVLGLFFLITPHTPAIGDISFYPENAPALWSRVLIGEGGIEVWTEPTGGDGKYPYLDPSTGLPYRVSHDGFIWENNYNPSPGALNVWVPGEFGWTQIEPL